MDSFHDTSPMGSINASINKMDRTATTECTGGAASRQKSCNACVRGKRRCDKRTPRCTRCATKGLDCIYQRQPPSQPSSAMPVTAAPSVSASSVSGGVDGNSTTPELMPDFDMSFDMESLGTETSPESMHLGGESHHQQHVHQHEANQDIGFSLMDLLASSGAVPGTTGGLWDLQGFGDAGSKMDIPPVPIAQPLSTPQQQQQHQQHQQQHHQQQQHQTPQPTRDLSLLDRDQCVITADVLQVHDPRSKIGYIVQYLSKLHISFAHTRETPFIHPRLWATQVPKTVMTAFSASASYASRSAATKGWSLKHLVDAVREVHRDGERATTHVDRLARVQALMILNAMRIFDGDIGVRASAEREMTVLLSWLKDLVEVRNELQEGLPSAAVCTRDRPPKSWESWIMLESTRRTILATLAFICLIYLLKSEEPPENIWDDGHAFTASRHLWQATSSVEFFRAWREKPQYCITDMGFKDFWMYGCADDMDEFTQMMLTPQVGVNAVEHFMIGDTSIPVSADGNM